VVEVSPPPGKYHSKRQSLSPIETEIVHFQSIVITGTGYASAKRSRSADKSSALSANFEQPGSHSQTGMGFWRDAHWNCPEYFQ